MICDRCREGGALNLEMNRTTSSAAGIILEYNAQLCHAECAGGTYCDCQHFVGAGLLNPERVTNGTT